MHVVNRGRIPLINALSAREILTELYPGRRFQDMNSIEFQMKADGH